jgi:hypothetical protein
MYVRKQENYRSMTLIERVEKISADCADHLCGSPGVVVTEFAKSFSIGAADQPSHADLFERQVLSFSVNDTIQHEAFSRVGVSTSDKREFSMREMLLILCNFNTHFFHISVIVLCFKVMHFAANHFAFPIAH